jgi:hypothetical protein
MSEARVLGPPLWKGLEGSGTDLEMLFSQEETFPGWNRQTSHLFHHLFYSISGFCRKKDPFLLPYLSNMVTVSGFPQRMAGEEAWLPGS